MSNATHTPSELHTPILVALADLSGNTADSSVARVGVLEHLIQDLGLDPETKMGQDAKGREYIDMYTSKAMHELKGIGLAASPKRGQWAITRNGLVDIGRLAFDSSDSSGSSETTKAEPAIAAKDETVITNTAPNVSSDDSDDVDDALLSEDGDDGDDLETATVEETTAPVWATDPYIAELMQASTACFGAHSSRSKSCRVCPLQGRCMVQTLEAFIEVAASCPVGMAEIPPEPEPVETVEETKSEATPPFAAETNYTTFPAAADCFCSITGAMIKKGETAAFIHQKGIMSLEAAKSLQK